MQLSRTRSSAVPATRTARQPPCAAVRRPGQQALLARVGRRPSVVAAAADVNAPDLEPDVYCCLGLAHCFVKNDEGRLSDFMVIEPISSASLECMATGAKTSFKCATGLTLGDATARDKQLLPDAFAEGTFCENYAERLESAVRTWQRPHPQDNLLDIVPLGKVRSNFNFNLDSKRVLNFENVVTDDDNVKQDMSIDVYGRADKKARDEAMAKAAAEAEEATKAKAEQEESDLDALLAA